VRVSSSSRSRYMIGNGMISTAAGNIRCDNE
jgi:hypothetical protein